MSTIETLEYALLACRALGQIFNSPYRSCEERSLDYSEGQPDNQSAPKPPTIRSRMRHYIMIFLRNAGLAYYLLALIQHLPPAGR